MTEPTDAEIDDVTVNVIGYAALDKETNETARMIARAVLAKWGQPAQAAEPVAWLRNTTDPQPHAVTNLKYRSAVDAKAGVEYIPVFAAPQPVEREPQCWCLTCRPMRFEDPCSIRMALCPTCGNKRCPKANDHRNECTVSNEPGQPGSAYTGGIKGGQHVGNVD